MRRTSWLLVLVCVCNALFAQSPATVNNDDSCDVIVAPAATLLLPYFEVDLQHPGAAGATRTSQLSSLLTVAGEPFSNAA